MSTHPQGRLAARVVAALAALFALAALSWNWWAERNPQQERRLRVELQDQLVLSFPAAMQPADERYGLVRTGSDGRRRLRVVLVHGLDEPGDIWTDLLPVLGSAGFETWEFRYPNDQGIDRSSDLLASNWTRIPGDLPVVLIGHSMGGLVIRDFVTRWRHPVAMLPQVAGASVHGVILAGTPNQGSEWARLRVWLELRDQWAAGRQWGFSPFAGLHDGTGAAKVDLRPGSRFLDELNERPWPQEIPLSIIGGELLPSTPSLGDGVVATDSLAAPGAPPPILVEASHRGMLVRLLESEPEPPAIRVILRLLDGQDRGD